MRSVDLPSEYRWDREVVELLRTHGEDRFRRVDIWDELDWNEVSMRLGVDARHGSHI